MHSKRGFTLVEVLFVVIIAAGVMAFAMPAYKRMQERANYNAALGTLLDIGNAVNSLKRDLKANTGVSITFPNSSSYAITTSSVVFPSTEVSGSWNQWLVSNMSDDRFVGALFTFKYLKPIQNTKDYNFFVVNGNASVCSGKCQGDVVACMCKSGTTYGCYYGAKLLSDGKVERLKEGTNCN